MDAEERAEERRGGGRILVPLDGSPKGEWALPLALAVARRSGSGIHLAAVEQPYPVSFRNVLLQPVRWARAYLAKTRERIRGSGFEDVEIAVLAGEIVPALETVSQRVDPELIVMATHGRGALSRLWLGSVTDAFIRHTRRPVVVVRPQQDAGPASLTEEPGLGRFLLTLDGSPASEAVLGPALALSRLVDAQVTMLRVVQFPPDIPPPFLTGTDVGDAPYRETLRREARTYMDGVVADLEARGVPATGVVRVAERPADAILEAASEGPADLIAMATHGGGALGRFVVGSVADKVLRGATAPVLLVHQKGE